MPPRATDKGKKRASPDDEDVDAPSTSNSTKRPKRAETRECPICHEPIPLRLLGQHVQLESERVQNILDHVGELAEFADPYAAGTSSEPLSRRRSTTKHQPQPAAYSDGTTKALRGVRKRRRARHTLLRDATRDDEPRTARGRSRTATSEPCPICRQTIAGDPDVFAAHVDACLAHAALVEQQQHHSRSATPEEFDMDVDVGDADEGDIDVDGGDPWEEIAGPDGVSRLRLRASNAGARALGFDVRDSSAQDVDIDVDIDGDDEVAFGVAQFTEADVDGAEVPGALMEEADIEAAISSARRNGDDRALILALENKVKFLQTSPSSAAVTTNSSCRICLDAYVEPTVSTGCWHACCRECWLRCIGSNKLCPICKRITAASDLRRVFL
ncbi:hypothetical protein PENSPDRAFT_646600 [Peniophora sp. CONT]|nr:hypothetical protein PENSPDRAFT_646600 [Peniophora sp. CONT]